MTTRHEDIHDWPVATVQHIDYIAAHPDGTANVFIQWKGTDVCLDFWCECGAGGHFDGYFAYALKCENCGAVWQMPSTVYPLKIDESELRSAGPVVIKQETDDDPEEGTNA